MCAWHECGKDFKGRNNNNLALEQDLSSGLPQQLYLHTWTSRILASCHTESWHEHLNTEANKYTML
jgi:hypothetical protein